MANVGGGVVDGLLFDSFEMEPRVRFGARFGISATVLFANFFSNSFGVCGRVLVLLVCGVDVLSAPIKKFFFREILCKKRGNFQITFANGFRFYFNRLLFISFGQFFTDQCTKL